MTTTALLGSQISHSALHYQDQSLVGVSRTFARTIPSLPEALRVPVTNAYLLCRIADTIEDDPGLEVEVKRTFGRRFVAVIAGRHDPGDFARAVEPALSQHVLEAERNLIVNCPTVIEVTRGLSEREQSAILRCIAVMSDGMHDYQQRAGLHGLRDTGELDAYCYFVAGVVGEMLTELFCHHSPEIAARRDRMMQLAPSFGQGLQMTNILKDIWEDRKRGACWLPQSAFGPAERTVDDLVGQTSAAEFSRGLEQLVAIAHGHLENALEYTLLIPSRHKGIRRFCLWALGLGVLTLRKIHRNPGFASSREVKVTRRTVGLVVRVCGALAGRDRLLRGLFSLASVGLPRARGGVASTWPASGSVPDEGREVEQVKIKPSVKSGRSGTHG